MVKRDAGSSMITGSWTPQFGGGGGRRVVKLFASSLRNGCESQGSARSN